MQKKLLLMQPCADVEKCRTMNDVIAYLRASHPTREKVRLLAIHDACERSEEEEHFLQQYVKNFEGISWVHSQYVLPLRTIIGFYKQLHPARAIQQVIDCFEAKERNEKEDEFLSEHQRLFNGEWVVQKYSLPEIMERFYRATIHSEVQKNMIMLYEKNNRTDEENLALADGQYRYNRAIWDDIERQYQRFGERIW